MALRFAKVSEEEIVAINKAAFFYPSDLVNTKCAYVRVTGHKNPRRTPKLRFASRYISTTIHLPFGGLLYI